MYPELLPLYGPFSIQTFGVFIALGIIAFGYGVLTDQRRKKIITSDDFFNMLLIGFIAALVGGRILFSLTNWQSLESCWQFFAVWLGGFSLLGSVIGIILVIPWYLYAKGIALLPFLDLACTYTPLLQSISRIGCFFAGCCYGSPTQSSVLPFTIHPTQLYSSAFLFLIFLVVYHLSKKSLLKPGQLACIYILLMSIERFFVDFFRGDRELLTQAQNFSVAQLIASILIVASLIGFFYCALLSKKTA